MLTRLVLIAALLGLLVGGGAYWLLGAASGPKPGPHTVIVEEGSTLGSVARQLEKAGAIPGSASTYRTMARIFGSDDPIQAGEVEIPKGMGGSDTLDLLKHGKPVQRLITVTEGMPSIIVQERLAAVPYLTGAAPHPAEGTVLPDSYGYKRGETRAAVAQRMQAAMSKMIDQLWARRQ